MFLLVYPHVFDGVGRASPPPLAEWVIDSLVGSLYMSKLYMISLVIFSES